MPKKFIETGYVSQVECFADQSILLFEGVKDTIGQAATICEHLSALEIPVDLLTQNLPRDEYACIGISGPTDLFKKNVKSIAHKLVGKIAERVNIYNGYYKFCISGWFLQGPQGVLDKILHKLGKLDIEVIMMSLSSSRMEFLVSKDDHKKTMGIVQSTIKSPELSTIESVGRGTSVNK